MTLTQKHACITIFTCMGLLEALLRTRHSSQLQMSSTPTGTQSCRVPAPDPAGMLRSQPAESRPCAHHQELPQAGVIPCMDHARVVFSWQQSILPVSMHETQQRDRHDGMQGQEDRAQQGAGEGARKLPLLREALQGQQGSGQSRGSLTPGRRRDLQASCTKNPALTMQQVQPPAGSLVWHAGS